MDVWRDRHQLKWDLIFHLPPMSSTDLAERLKENDIYIHASKTEACSNSIIEARHCSLPVIGPNSSSNPEVIGTPDLLFEKAEQIPQIIEKIVHNYEKYQGNLLSRIEDVGEAYETFMEKIYTNRIGGISRAKPFGRLKYLHVLAIIKRWQLSEKLQLLFHR